jgi:hypothetical protein
MATLSLKFTLDELSDTAKSFLEQRFMEEDYESMWCSIESILEEIANCDGTIFTGVALPEKFNWNRKRYTLADIPKEWWKLMKFGMSVERKMKAFWKKHPDGEIRWGW